MILLSDLILLQQKKITRQTECLIKALSGQQLSPKEKAFYFGKKKEGLELKKCDSEKIRAEIEALRCILLQVDKNIRACSYSQ